MNNVIDLNSFKQNKKSKPHYDEDDIDQQLSDMKQQLFGDTRTAKQINTLFSEAKKILRSRGLTKIRVKHNSFPNLKSTQTIILEKEKLIFSTSALKGKQLKSDWKLISLETRKLHEPIHLVSLVITTYEGEKNER
ncbi:hypothetical protein [Pseudoalteromonas sp. APC 3691]|uniref:hypothetical protein n=1 Tax=Pseudoalteromonas sp. APC 3691 TaxID=3035173 RepID=UPI0025B4B9C0|nr:hypothetical protein [Pseudoalteromonas sp. APC 3691]MDN3393160.1 hypothetical protein [Pseudoalteromonas sp. APC 3691]